MAYNTISKLYLGWTFLSLCFKTWSICLTPLSWSLSHGDAYWPGNLKGYYRNFGPLQVNWGTKHITRRDE